VGETTNISWTHHTHNIAWGCTKVGPPCDFCYAEVWAKRLGLNNLWGPDADRRTFGDKYWNQPLKWDRDAAAAGERRRVFCSSMADVFDNHPKLPAERLRLWELIIATPNLDWLLLTKRVGNVWRMLPLRWQSRLPANVWLGISVGLQSEADRDIDKLRAIPAAVRFISFEPMLGPIVPDLTGIHLAIIGGESGPHARPMHPAWARSLRDQCVTAGVAFHFKQWGEWAPGECASGPPTRTERVATWWDGEWRFGRQSHLTPSRSSDEPDLFRLGKKAAGRMLDGRVWDEFPETQARA
jgi:protein gp37